LRGYIIAQKLPDGQSILLQNVWLKLSVPISLAV
jgi:hypothetical protein